MLVLGLWLQASSPACFPVSLHAAARHQFVNLDPAPEVPNFTGCPLVKGHDHSPLTCHQTCSDHFQLPKPGQAALKGVLWQREAPQLLLGAEESSYVQAQQSIPSQAAPAHSAHLVMLLEQPLQELVAQVVELCGAARRQPESGGGDTSEL